MKNNTDAICFLIFAVIIVTILLLYRPKPEPVDETSTSESEFPIESYGLNAEWTHIHPLLEMADTFITVEGEYGFQTTNYSWGHPITEKIELTFPVEAIQFTVEKNEPMVEITLDMVTKMTIEEFRNFGVLYVAVLSYDFPSDSLVLFDRKLTVSYGEYIECLCKELLPEWILE